MSLYKNSERKNIYVKIFGIIIITAFIIILIIFNQNQGTVYSVNVEGEIPVNIIVTEDFGSSIIIDEDIFIESGESVIDAIQKISTVTTTYGGGYIESINGVKSKYSTLNGQKIDWLYYINGMLASVGAGIYKPHEGDTVYWDFHDWSSDRMVTAIIGNYPEPFLHGYNGVIAKTNIVYSKEFYDTAILLEKSLEEYGISVESKNFEDLNEEEKKNNNLIFIGTYENDFISELNKNADKLGWFIEFNDNKLITYNQKGEINHIYEHGGIICAMPNTWNPKGNWHCDNALWVITGTSEDDVNAAADILIKNSSDIKNFVSIIISNGKINKVP